MASSLRAIGGKCRALTAPFRTASSSSYASFSSKATTAAAKPVKGTTTSSAAATRGILKPFPVSPTLREFVGAPESSRTDAVKKVWEYIKLHNLQNPTNKKEIICDAKLKNLFSGKDRVNFLEVAKLISQHFVKSG